jgi:hypothetical protein
MKEAARVGKFVPLANFLPSSSGALQAQFGVAPGGPIGDAIEAEHFAQYSDRNPIATTKALYAKHAEVPRFRRWEDVVVAFWGGLIPAACQGNPRRLRDYSAFFGAVSLQQALGAEHWPVLLRFIEDWRQDRQPEGMDPTAIAARTSHILSDDTDLSTAGTFLHGTIYNEARFQWETDPYAVAQENFLHVDVVKALSKAATPAASLSKETNDVVEDASSPSPSQQRSRPNARPPPTGDASLLTDEQADALKKTGSCINHVLKIPCRKDPCPYAHRPVAEAKRIAKSNAAGTASTAMASSKQ